MEHAGRRRAALTEPDIAARSLLEHEGEILGAHGRLGVAVDVAGTDYLRRHRGREGSFGFAIDGGRITAVVGDFGDGAKGGGDLFGESFQPPFKSLLGCRLEAAHRPRKGDVVRDDIEGGTAINHGHADHRGVNRVDAATDQGLGGGDDVGGDQDRVDAEMGHGAVPALAGDGDAEPIGGSHDRPGAYAEAAGRQLRPIVQAEHGIAGETVEQAPLNHDPGAAGPFLGGLEDQVDGAVEVVGFGQIACRSQQHGSMAVVAAAVHLARRPGGVSEAVLLGHGERVHVGAQPDAAAALALPQHTHNAGSGQPAMNLNANRGKTVRDEVGGGLLLESEFGVGVKMAAPPDHFVVPGGNAVEDGHGERGSLAGRQNTDSTSNRWHEVAHSRTTVQVIGTGNPKNRCIGRATAGLVGDHPKVHGVAVMVVGRSMADRWRARRTALGVGLAMAGALALAGCVAPVVIGAAGTAGVKATEQRGLAGAVSDAQIQLKINEVWFNTDGDLYSRMNLTVDQGRVMVTGRAASAEQRATAVRLAGSVEGVREVINEVTVDSPGSLIDNAQDSWIGTQLRTALVLDGSVKSSNYSIEVVGGVVYLLGVARDQPELDRVIGHAKALAHVQGVISHVRVL